MKRMTIAAILVTCIAALGVSEMLACSWPIGYFYQVASLRGKVVGSRFPVLHSFRWFRQSVERPQTKLALYEYCWPCDLRDVAPVKTVLTGAHGEFDFGVLKPNHYYLSLVDDADSLSDWFDVEVKGTPNSKESVVIDISPVQPDCTGGHQFVIREN